MKCIWMAMLALLAMIVVVLQGCESKSDELSGAPAGGTDGTKGTVALPEEYDATKPLPSTELSAENITSMLPKVAVTRGGMLLPLNAPSTVPLLLEPS